MFEPLQAEVKQRFTAVEAFFKAAHNLKGDAAVVARGIVFVQIYAVYEYAATTVFQIAIDKLKEHRHPMKSLSPSLSALFLDAELRSLVDGGAKQFWKRRVAIFEKAYSNEPATVANTVFPKDGSHFRKEQLQTMFMVLGIKRTPAQRQKHLLRVDEVVNHRNAVAHGRETAEAIGRRYTRAEILHIIQEMRSVCTLLVNAIRIHCDSPDKHCKSEAN
jgi:hypothetical protein